MKYTVRIVIAALTLTFVAACADTPPPVTPTVHSEKVYKKTRK